MLAATFALAATTAGAAEIDCSLVDFDQLVRESSVVALVEVQSILSVGVVEIPDAKYRAAFNSDGISYRYLAVKVLDVLSGSLVPGAVGTALEIDECEDCSDASPAYNPHGPGARNFTFGFDPASYDRASQEHFDFMVSIESDLLARFPETDIFTYSPCQYQHVVGDPLTDGSAQMSEAIRQILK